MTEITDVDLYKPALPSSLPGPSSLEAFEMACREFCAMAGSTKTALEQLRYPGGLRGDTRARIDLRIATAEQFRNAEFETFLRTAEKSKRPATSAEIAKCAKKLVAAMAGRRADMGEFAAVLLEDIAALQPSIVAVEAGLRELRRREDCAFLPSIGEVRAAITKAEKRMDETIAQARQFAEMVDGVPALIARAEEAERQRQAEEEAERARREIDRQTEKAAIRRRLDDGKNVTMCNRHLVNEVIAEIAAEEAAAESASSADGPHASHVHAREGTAIASREDFE